MPSTPVHGIPYPLHADPPDGATQLRALAEAVDALSWTETTRAFVRLERRTNQSVIADDWTRVQFDYKSNDAANITVIGAGAGVNPPRAGMMYFAWSVDLGIGSGTPATGNFVSCLYQGANEVARGSHLTIANAGSVVHAFSTVGSAVVPVAVGEHWHIDVYVSAPGLVKSIVAGATATWLAGYYLP